MVLFIVCLVILVIQVWWQRTVLISFFLVGLGGLVSLVSLIGPMSPDGPIVGLVGRRI